MYAPRPTGTVALLALFAAACGRPQSAADVGTAVPAEPVPVVSAEADSAPSSPGLIARVASALGFRRAADDPTSYEGHDSHDIPHYATTRTFTPDEARVLREAYGIEDPHRLYVSDSTAEGILKYDTQVKRCLTCYVNSYRVGFISVRHAHESWEETERRVRSTPPREFTTSGTAASESLVDLDPDVRPYAEQLLAAARAQGFRLRVVGTYRSPMREAYLMAQGGGRTHTLTSMHTYGRALDVSVDDGVLAHARTHADWVAFRRWASRYRLENGESFRILGTPEHTWDWPHLELPTERIGFRTIEAAVDRARACVAPGSTTPCNFAPHLPETLTASVAAAQR